MGCVTKKIPDGSVKTLLNEYVGKHLIPCWVSEGPDQQQIAELAELAPSAISKVVRYQNGLSLDSLEKLALARGLTFLSLLRDAQAWKETPERSRIAKLAGVKPNRARAEAALERLGNAPEKVRLWAETVYAGFRPDEDPDPDTVMLRLILEKQRDPEGTGLPRLKRPSDWHNWVLVRNEFIKREDLHDLWGVMIFYGKTPTADQRPDPFEVNSLLPLVQKFSLAHPFSDERWTATINECAAEARTIERKLRRAKRKEQHNPITNTDEAPTPPESQIPTHTPSSSAPPPSKKR